MCWYGCVDESVCVGMGVWMNHCVLVCMCMYVWMNHCELVWVCG